MSTQSANKTIVTVGTAPVSPYSQAVKAGGLIYVSGTLSQDAAGDIVAEGRRQGRRRRASSSACARC